MEPPSDAFVNIQIDFIHMSSRQGFKYLIVITEQTKLPCCGWMSSQKKKLTDFEKISFAGIGEAPKIIGGTSSSF